MPKIKLSLKPLQDSRWETHEATGVEFLIAPLTADIDQEMTDKSSNLMGQVNSLAYAKGVAPRIVKDWRGVTDEKGAPAPCNLESLEAFVNSHGNTIMPWIIRRARSLDHYREQEVDAAKKD